MIALRIELLVNSIKIRVINGRLFCNMKIMVKTHDKNALYVVYVSLFVFLREFSHVNAETTVKAKYELPNENTTRFVDPPVSRKDNLQNLGPEESKSTVL